MPPDTEPASAQPKRPSRPTLETLQLGIKHAREKRQETIRREGYFFGRALKVDALLREEDRAAYDQLISRPGTTGPACKKWLEERGYDFTMHAVRTSMKRFRETLRSARKAAQRARIFAKAVKDLGPLETANATVVYVEQWMMEAFFRLGQVKDMEKELDPKFWQEVNKSLGAALRNRECLEEIRQQLKKAADAADAAASKGESAADVAAKVRAMLGVGPAIPPSGPLSPVLRGEG